jgi:hypothetical protein
MLTTRKLHSLILATALLTPVASAENEQIENIFVTASRSAIEANTLPLSWAIVDFESLDTISHTHINESVVPGSVAAMGRNILPHCAHLF